MLAERGLARLGVVLGALLWPGLVARADPPTNPPLASCERDVAAHPDLRESWGCFYDHARTHGDWAETAAALRASLAQVEAASRSTLMLGYAHLSLANVVAELDNAASIELYETAADELERGDDPLALTLTLLNLSHRHRVAGEPSRSADDLRRAERAAARFGDQRWIATVKVERVRHTLRTGGDLGVAARWLAQTEPLLFPDGDYQSRLNWLAAALSVQRGLGQLELARTLADRHVALVVGAGDTFAEASVRFNRIDIMIAQAIGNGEQRPSDELLAEVEAAMAAGQAGSNRWAEVSLRLLQSNLWLTRGASEAAEALARRGYVEAQELGDPRLKIDAALAVVEVVVHGGRPLDEGRLAEVERLLSAAKTEARESTVAYSELMVISAEAELRWLLGPRERAIAASESLLAAIERLRADQSDPTSRAEFQGAQADAFERYIDHLLRQAQSDPGGRQALIARAFEVGERFRARVLRESLLAAGATRAPDPEWLSQLAAVQLRLSDADLPTEERAAALDELGVLERRELETLGEPGENEPLGAPRLGLAEIRSTLAEREALLVYQLPTPRELDPSRRKRAWVLVITRDRADAIELDAREQIVSRAAMLGPLIERRDLAVDTAASKLGSLLLDDALAVLPERIDTLSVVLDGPLHQLALASLRTGSEARPLFERFAVGAVPSASILAAWRLQRSAARSTIAAPGLLALADPPAVHTSGSSPRSRERSASLVDGLVLPPLPLARREAQLAAHLERDTLWVGDRASETALAQLELERFAVIHFATHALIDEQHPGRSAIVLARGGSDGLLQPREIAGLELDGKLVVLSACSTARGRVISGEGVMGLAHAMFGAGAHTVVASLWPLRDDDALALFERFYPSLEAGDDVATALRKAQRDRAAAGAPAAAWAGVVVLGDPRFVPFPGGRSGHEQTTASGEPRHHRALALGGLLAALGLAIGAARLRRRR